MGGWVEGRDLRMMAKGCRDEAVQSRVDEMGECL